MINLMCVIVMIKTVLSCLRSHQRIHTDNKPYVWKTSDIDIKRAMNDEHLNDHHFSLKINLMCAIRVIQMK